MQVADKDAPVAWSARSFREMLRAPSSVERDVCREQLVSTTAGLPGRGEREPRTTNVADHGRDLVRLAIGVLVIASADPRRTEAGVLRNDPVGAA